MNTPTPRPGIMDIAPYIGGESKAAPGQRLIRLASNEGAYGPPPQAVDALQACAHDAHRYPDGAAQELRDALARKHGISAEQIVCGAGSDELISLLCRAYAGPGDEVLHSQYGFLMYAIAAKACGATPVSASESQLHTDVDALLTAVTPRTKLLFLANPNNPTGTLLPRSEIARLHAGLRPDILLVLDAAYAEFVTGSAYSAGDELVKRGNVVVLRTFSKIYALAAARLGWAHCPSEVASVLNRVRGPFNVSALAQIAGLAALRDEAFIHHAHQENVKVRTAFCERLTALGLTYAPSHGNFVLVKFGPKAESIRLALKSQGILVRQMGAYGLPEYLRITMGTADDMTHVANALPPLL